MTDPILMLEEYFDLDFATETYRIDITVGDEAALLTASLWNDNRNDTRREQGRLVVKTRGYVGRMKRRATVIVMRRTSKVMNLPPDCGRFVGEFGSRYDFHRWFVFEARPFLAPARPDIPEEPLPPELGGPPRAVKSSTPTLARASAPAPSTLLPALTAEAGLSDLFGEEPPPPKG